VHKLLIKHVISVSTGPGPRHSGPTSLRFSLLTFFGPDLVHV